MKPSPLLSVLALLLMVISPVIFVLKISERKYDPNYISDGISSKAKLEMKKDSTGKDTAPEKNGAGGNVVSFICVSYRITADVPQDTIQRDSLYMDSVAAMRRMMIVENFKIEIPGMKFATIEVAKNTFDKLHEGDSVKIVYSPYDPEHVRLEEENSAPVADQTRSTWLTISIISFMAGIWLFIMNKRRRAQGQESDPLSGLTSYSSIKKNEPPETGGRPS